MITCPAMVPVNVELCPEANSVTAKRIAASPVPTIGGGSSARLKDGAYDQREDPRFPPSRAPFLPLRSRADVLVFETAPLVEDVEVTGPISVVVYASSNRTDTDFTAKLVDVYPPSADWPGGFDLNLTDAHAIAHQAHDRLRDHIPKLQEATMHVSPSRSARPLSLSSPAPGLDVP